MILIVSKEEQELIKRLRDLAPAGPLSEEVLNLKREIADLTIKRDQQKETHDREERELRHMIGLEKNRQQVEMEQAKREATLTVREENLKAQQERFEEQLKFNTARFEKMESYLKDMLTDILGRLPNVNVRIRREEKES